MITIDDFAKVEIRVETVLEAEDGPVFLTVPKKVPPGTKIR